jgi:hypothetical protein
MPGEAGSGPAFWAETVGCGASSGSSKFRAPRASRWSIASLAWGPDARISTWWPCRAASVATRLRLDAGTGPAPVVRLRSRTCASRPRISATRRAAGRACIPWRFETVNVATISASSPTGGAPREVSCGPLKCAALPIRAPCASVATSLRPAPPAAATAATTSPSTSGAADRMTRSRTSGSSRRSRASSALRTALPRSISTTTPSGLSTS